MADNPTNIVEVMNVKKEWPGNKTPVHMALTSASLGMGTASQLQCTSQNPGTYEEYKVVSIPATSARTEEKMDIAELIGAFTDQDQASSDLEVQSVMCPETRGLLPTLKRLCPSRSSSSGKSSNFSYSPMKHTMALTNTKRGNILTVTPTLPLDLPIHQLAAQGELAFVAEKLEQGYEVDERDPEGLTPILWACSHGQKDTVQFLVDRGADLHAIGRDGETALAFACSSGNRELVKYLLNQNVEVNVYDWNGGTPLLYAVINNHAPCVELMLQAGADITMETESGYNALALSIALGHVKVQKTIERHMLGLLSK